MIKNRASLSLTWDSEEDILPIGLWDVKAPTFSIQSVYRWRWGCQPYTPATLYPQEDPWTHFS
jgi:hypothetical protein